MPVQFELVSPERLIISTEVDMVVVPGTEGNFGVLPGHSPLISTIRPGTIDIYQGGAVTERVFVVGGIAEVTPERCTVLAEDAMPPDALERGAIEAELQTAESHLPILRDQIGRAQGTERERLATELRHLERQQSVARAKLQALAELSRRHPTTLEVRNNRYKDVSESGRVLTEAIQHEQTQRVPAKTPVRHNRSR